MNTKKFSLQTPFHPFLFAIYPVFTYIANNRAQIQIWEIWRIFIGSVAASVLLYLIAIVLVKNIRKAALISTLLILAFFSFIHVYSSLLSSPFPIARIDVFTAIWVVICFLGVWWIWRKMKRLDAPTQFLNIVSVLALILPIYATTRLLIDHDQVSFDRPDSSELDMVLGSETRPDIYYIILDGYGREDFLKQNYGFDNQEFITYLKNTGFFVAEQSHTNYNQTALSLASSLNLQYINELTHQIGVSDDSRQPLADLIRNSQARSILGEMGYHFVAFSSGYNATEIQDADLYIDLSPVLHRLEKEFLSTTFAVLWLDRLIPDWYRSELMAVFDQLPVIPDQQAPMFVFAHILMPHPPFAFGPNGEELPTSGFTDGSYFQGTREEYIQGYKGQLAFLNRKVEVLISQIIANSDTPPIIILQGDHGPGATLDWDHIEQECYQERMSILNAYYLPGGVHTRLYSTISPVNTFRTVFNSYFDTDYELLEDRAFFSTWTTPYDLTDITASVNQCSISAFPDISNDSQTRSTGFTGE